MYEKACVKERNPRCSGLKPGVEMISCCEMVKAKEATTVTVTRSQMGAGSFLAMDGESAIPAFAAVGHSEISPNGPTCAIVWRGGNLGGQASC